MNLSLIEIEIQSGKIQNLTAGRGSIGVNQVIAIISPLVVQKEEVGVKEENCGT